MPSIRDVAAKAGVSTASVSRAFHDDPRIRPETQRHILKVAAEMGYCLPDMQHHEHADSERHIRTIGIILYDIDNPWFMYVTKEIEKILNTEGYSLMIMFDKDDRSREEECLRCFASANVDGIIFQPKDKRSEQTVKDLTARGVRFLQLFAGCDQYEGMTRVIFDDDYGYYTLTRHLIEKGHRRILVVGPDHIEPAKKAYDEAGVDMSEFEILPCFLMEDPYSLIRDKIAEFKPTGIFSWADKNSRCVVRALEELGLSYPEDVSFVVYDNLPWTSMMGITTMGQSIEVLADTAAHHMLHMLRSKSFRGFAQSAILPYMKERRSVKDRKTE